MTAAVDPKTLWFPVASSAELPLRHVYHGKLLGQEFAVWRADDGAVNVWENRCLHRGVRLSIGLNLGTELKCQYHGWRYASGEASCLYIPAHPANAPARTIRNRVYPAVERHGLVWSAIEPESDAPEEIDGPALALRPIPVEAPAALVVEALGRHAFQPTAAIVSDAAATCEASPAGDFAMRIVSRAGDAAATAVFYVQPTGARASILRGVLLEEVPETSKIAVLRHHNGALTALRERIERRAERLGDAAPAVSEIEIPLSPRVTTVAGVETRPADDLIRVRVAKKWPVAADIVALKLEPVSGELPAPAPGAHVDLHLPNGLVRQYSLTNGPDERASYVVAVKREPQSKGGSAAVHDAVREGDLLAVSAPHDNFALARKADAHVLVAGGVGITPLIAMAKALAAAGKPFQLHVFARSAEHVAFPETLDGFGDAVVRHVGLDPQATGAALDALLAGRSGDPHLYVCGPGPMLETAIARAEAAGWPESAVHFEYFANDKASGEGEAFEVALARSALTIEIPADRTITDVLREHGVSVPTSCEQGACGTCLVTVLEGEPDHRDVYLSKAEHASNTCMTPCISRSKSPRLTLDL